jgi:hypothetical protein
VAKSSSVLISPAMLSGGASTRDLREVPRR